jgi:hypothetical protein
MKTYLIWDKEDQDEDEALKFTACDKELAMMQFAKKYYEPDCEYYDSLINDGREVLIKDVKTGKIFEGIINAEPCIEFRSTVIGL